MKFTSDKLRLANSAETKKIFEDFPILKQLHVNYDLTVTDILILLENLLITMILSSGYIAC
jgi:hypothetical protein